MAIYHLSASIVKRSAGRSVTAAAAYRAAAKIEDIKTGIIHDYTRKQGVDYSEIISPVSPNPNSSNEWLTNRAELWNKVEQIEKRKDAQLAREVTIAIPTELSKIEQIALVREYVNTNYVAAGMIVDINLHHLDGDNPHAHILLTMRNLQTSPAGVVGFGLKNTDWNSKELLLAQRKSWEEITNKYLTAGGLDTRIDCRSLEEQGNPFIPQIHVGVHAMAMKRKGIATDRSDEFERIETINNDIRTRLEVVYQEEYTEPEPNLEEESIDVKNDELGKSLDSLLKKWGQRIFFPEDIELTFYRYRDDQISVYVNKTQPMATRVYSLKLINDSWIDVLKTSEHKYSINTLTTLVNNQHDRFDTGEIKRLELNYRELKEIPDFEAWRGLELNDHRLTQIRKRGIEIITTDLAQYLGEWIKKNIPETDDILTKDRIREIIDNSSDSIIFINNNRSNSVYTSYIILDKEENKSLEIRYNRNKFERIDGIITPLISKQIKDVINNLESITQKQELISPGVIDINLEPVIALSNQEAIVITPNLFEKIDPNNSPLSRSPISDGNPLNHIRNALKMALEKEPKPTAVQTSTVTPIPTTPPNLQPSQSPEIIVVTPDIPIIRLDPIDVNLEPVTSLLDKKIIKPRQKRFDRGGR